MREFKEGITGEGKDEDKPEITEAGKATDSAAAVQDRPAQPAATPGSAEAGSERRP
jgi:hypothetical protein